MSYDLFFQRFKGGNAAPGGGDAVRSILEPHVTRSEPTHSFVRIDAEDGGADVYLSDDHMMVNHVEGTSAWDLLVSAATAANWAILLLGGPTAVTHEIQRAELPAELAGGSSRGHNRDRPAPHHRMCLRGVRAVSRFSCMPSCTNALHRAVRVTACVERASHASRHVCVRLRQTWTRSLILDSAKPFPPFEEMVIEDLTEDEDRIFLETILNA